MPHFIIFDPLSAPVAGRVVQYRTSVAADAMEGIPNTIRYDTDGPPPDILALAGVPQSRWKVFAGGVIAMSAGDIQAIQDARDAQELSTLKDKAKEYLSRDQSAQERAFKQAIETVLELTVAEINLLRAEHSLAARTNAQVRNAFHAAYIAKIESIT